MIYRVIGLMSGSSLDGLDIAFVHLEETAGRWTFDIKHTACIAYTEEWASRLRTSGTLAARDYLLLDVAYGHLIGGMVRDFIQAKELGYQVQFIVSHGHTVFHLPEKKMTAQLGDGASICAETALPVISNLRSMDVARGGQGAPVVPVGEKLLFSGIKMFLNLGGIANISASEPVRVGYDVCAANRVLNEISTGLPGGFDKDGNTAATGQIDVTLLAALNALEYYGEPYPKSLANDFGLDIVLPMIREAGLDQADALRTYVEHVVTKVTAAAGSLAASILALQEEKNTPVKMLVTGGGAHNTFLMQRLRESLASVQVLVEIPSDAIVDYKEALIMALIGALRWREDVNVFASVTGANADSVNGAVYIP